MNGDFRRSKEIIKRDFITSVGDININIAWIFKPAAKEYGYIYRITSPNGRIYIGKTENLKIRLKSYNNSKKEKRLVSNVINKYGFENCSFDIIANPSIEDLNYVERYYIDFYKSNYSKYPESNGLNLTDGGDGTKGYKCSDELKKVRSINATGVKNSFYGKKHSEETLKFLSERQKGVDNANYGKAQTDEQRIKTSKAVIQYSKDLLFIKEFWGIGSAENETGIDGSGISKCCRGKLKTCGGFVWRHKDES